MIARRTFLLLTLAACARGPRFRDYDGPEVTEVRVLKADRRMELWSGATRLRTYDIALGANPLGHKQQRGDSRTPEGTYRIDRRNPASAFHLSLGIDYPNVEDVARARAAGVDPGGDIFIHGTGQRSHFSRYRRGDWTDGCIAVTNRQIEEVYAMVGDGTRIVISA
ncbi:MAG: L,D-transpeptidase family protein [Rhodobacteraceae bacterium]|nr:L,D-transpeptidase family protein [Paracoccaceae bacterium]